MNINVLTLFPEMFHNVLRESIIGRAQEDNIISINTINIRDFSHNKHKKVDDYTYGGGKGMLLTCQPIFHALESLTQNRRKERIIYLTPKGKTFNQSIAKNLSKEENLIMICGHYEGLDQRVIDNWVTDEISIGDYVLTGGELPAMVLIDSIVRLIPGVLSNEDSYKDDSFYNGLLEYPQYTRPSNYEGLNVPEILLSGNHALISQWKLIKSIEETINKRPDLITHIYNRKDINYKEKTKIKEIILEYIGNRDNNS